MTRWLPDPVRSFVRPTAGAAPAEAPAPATRVRPDPGWEVVVWNDPVNTMSYVVYVFMKVLRFDQERARRHMMEVHTQGSSCVAREPRERAEFYHQEILLHGLHCTLRRAAQD